MLNDVASAVAVAMTVAVAGLSKRCEYEYISKSKNEFCFIFPTYDYVV